MEKLKDRWEFIIGYVALIVSLSAFKDELSLINLDLGFISFTGSQYLFALIISFLASLHLYLIPYLVSSTRFANLKVLSYIESLSYFIFVLLTVSPFFVLISMGINLLNNIFKSIPTDNGSIIYDLATVLIGILFGILSQYIATKFREQKYSSQKQELENLEITELENAQKLFAAGYYSQSILEAFKVLEIHLKRLIIQKDIPYRSNKIHDLIKIVRKLELLSNDEIEKFHEIRKMRNSAAHLDVEFTKSQANEAINFLKDLINKTSDQFENDAT